MATDIDQPRAHEGPQPPAPEPRDRRAFLSAMAGAGAGAAAAALRWARGGAASPTPGQGSSAQHHDPANSAHEHERSIGAAVLDTRTGGTGRRWHPRDRDGGDGNGVIGLHPGGSAGNGVAGFRLDDGLGDGLHGERLGTGGAAASRPSTRVSVSAMPSGRVEKGRVRVTRSSPIDTGRRMVSCRRLPLGRWHGICPVRTQREHGRRERRRVSTRRFGAGDGLNANREGEGEGHSVSAYRPAPGTAGPLGHQRHDGGGASSSGHRPQGRRRRTRSRRLPERGWRGIGDRRGAQGLRPRTRPRGVHSGSGGGSAIYAVGRLQFSSVGSGSIAAASDAARSRMPR